MKRPERSRRGRCAGALLLTLAFLQAPAAAQDPVVEAPAPVPPAAALQALEALRRVVDPAAARTEDSWQSQLVRGREALEVKGQLPGDAGAPAVRDLALYDVATGRVATLVWYPHASTRKAGEAIISLSEVSGLADACQRALLPRTSLALEGIQRFRESDQESVYYEARYSPQGDGTPFFEPPVRLLLNASTGKLFRYDVDPGWFDPPKVPKARISHQAAERIAAVALGGRDLSGICGVGASPAKVSAAELFLVRPNDWLGFFDASADSAIRVAWVVPFAIAGPAGRGGNHLFVDASSGRVLGGSAGTQPPAPVR